MRILYYICLVIILLSAILGIILWLNKRLDKKLYPVVVLVILSVIEEGLAYYFKVKYRNNLIIYYSFNPFDYGCYAWFMYLNIDFKRIKRLIQLSVIAFFVFIIAYCYFFLQLDGFTSSIALYYIIMAKGFLLSVWSIIFCKNIFDHISQYKKLNIFTLIIVGGVLFYFSFSTLFAISHNYLVNYAIAQNTSSINDALKVKTVANIYASKQLKDVQPLLYLTNILLYLCIFVALLKSATVSKKYNHSV